VLFILFNLTLQFAIDIDFMSEVRIFIDTCSMYWQPEFCADSLLGKCHQCSEFQMMFSCDHLSSCLVSLVCNRKRISIFRCDTEI